MIRPPDDVYYTALSEHYRSVRGYLPQVLTHISLEAAPAGLPLLAAYNWLRDQQDRNKPDNNAPREVIDNAWRRYVVQKDGGVDIRAYTFCVLSHLQTALHRRDVFTHPSWRYADPRANLLSDAEWKATRLIVCRTLGLPSDPQPILDSLAAELDKTYREVARRLPDNPDVRFEKVKDKEELILTPLDALDEPPSLIQLRKVVAERLPRVELAELVLEVALRTGFTQSFTHLTDRSARTTDFALRSSVKRQFFLSSSVSDEGPFGSIELWERYFALPGIDSAYSGHPHTIELTFNNLAIRQYDLIFFSGHGLSGGVFEFDGDPSLRRRSRRGRATLAFG